MSRTQRCILCTEAGIVNELEEDEVCSACGRCKNHCTGPHELTFRHNAKTLDDRPHPDAGRTVRIDYFGRDA